MKNLLLLLFLFAALSVPLLSQELSAEELTKLPEQQLLTMLDINLILQTSSYKELGNIFILLKDNSVLQANTITDLRLDLTNSNAAYQKAMQELLKVKESLTKAQGEMNIAKESLRKFKEEDLPAMLKKAKNDGIKTGILIGSGIVLVVGGVVVAIISFSKK